MAGCAEYFRIVETLVWRKTVIDHIGLEKFEYTDAIWVYWSRDLNQWDADNKAIVLDGKKSTWANKAIGLPSVLRVGTKLGSDPFFSQKSVWGSTW